MLVTVMPAVKNTAAATMIIAELTSQPMPIARLVSMSSKFISRRRRSGARSQSRDRITLECT